MQHTETDTGQAFHAPSSSLFLVIKTNNQYTHNNHTLISSYLFRPSNTISISGKSRKINQYIRTCSSSPSVCLYFPAII